MSKYLFTCLSLFVSLSGHAADSQLERGRQGILSRTGCFLVDYSFAETEAIKPGYVRDNRVYDVNIDKSVKEWIYATEISPSRIRLQHILFMANLEGVVDQDSIMKHTGEDWEFNASFLYDFIGTNNWNVMSLTATPNLWTRKVTNLDDGLRYQCAAAWNMTTAYPEWSCSNYAPIPGRETRDMKRRDYNTLQRTTRVISYGANWLERENNIKTVDDKGVRTPLVKEVGKIWYSRLPDSECGLARNFVNPRLAFWDLVREVWDGVLIGDRPYIEKAVPGESRYMDISDLEEEYIQKDLTNPAIREAARAAILKATEKYRAN